MASIGPIYPSTVVDDASTGIAVWSNPGNAKADDGVYASASVGTIGTKSPSHYLKATGFDASALPDNAVVDGIELAYERGVNGSGVGILDNAVRLVKGGVIQAGDRSDTLEWNGAGAGVVTKGGPTDLWDTTWTAADIKDPGFGAAVSVKKSGGQANCEIDFFRVTVYYHIPFEDIAASGATETGGQAKASRLRGVTASAATDQTGTVQASRVRGLQVRGATGSGGKARIGGGSVYVRASGGTETGGGVRVGRIRPAQASGATATGGRAKTEYLRNVNASGATETGGKAAASRVRSVRVRGASGSGGKARISLANRTFGHRLRLDVRDPVGSLVTRIPVVFGAEYRLGQDEVGEFSLSLPAADPRVALLASGQRIIVYREGEGPVFSGIVGKCETVQDAEGGELLAVTGASRARELVRRNTMTGASYEGLAVAAIATDLLDGTGWAPGDIATDPDGVTILGIGKSFWEMLAEVATRKGWHIRENNLAATVDIGPFGASSGLVVRNIAQARGWSDQDLAVLPLTGIKITEQQEDLVNQVVILGGGEGPNALTLRYATHATPYAVKQAVDQRGNPYWYIEDGASILAHGLHQGPPVVFKDIIPLANSAGSFTAAANALYEMGAAWLGWHANTVESYEISFVGLRHYDHGAAVLNPGDTLRLQYRGYVAREADGTAANRVYRDIDADLHVLDMRRSFNEDGSDTWAVTVSTSDQRAPDDAALMAETYARLHSVETALRPYTVSDTVGPLRDSVDSTHPFKMQVNFDANVTYLLKAKLEVLVRPVRSNTKSAASGGGVTSSGGSSHSHTINATTAMDEADPLHSHQIGVAADIVGWVTPAFRQQFQFAATRNGSAAYGVFVGRDSNTLPWTSIYTFSGFSHDHAISATTSSNESSHTHGVPPHTHGMVYGIYEGPNPSNPDLRLTINGVDVTAALGGPWDDDVTLDVTQFFVDATQQVLRQNHTIEVSSTVLADVIVSLKSILTIVGVHPV